MRQRIHFVARLVAHVGVICALTATRAGICDDAADLVAIRIEADSLKSEQMALGKRLVEQFPDSFHALRIMGFVYSTHGNQEEMAKCWKRCREISPDRPGIHHQLGRHALQLEQYEEAIQHWRKVLELDPKFPGVHLRIGTALLSAGRAAEAGSAIRQQLELTAKDPEAHYQLGESLFQQQQYDQAKQSYLQATKLHTQHSKAFYGLVKTCARLGQSDEVARYSKKFQELEEAAVRADQEYRRNFDDLQEVRRDVASAFVDAGRIYAAEEKFDEALRHWIRAADIDKKNEMARNFAAKVYLSKGRPKDALRLMKQLLKLSPKNAVYHQQAGVLMAGTRQIAGAEKHFRRVVELEPNRASGYRMLAKFYLNTRQRSDLAYDLAIQAAKLEPNADSYFVWGWASAQLNKIEQAKQALGKAIAMDPKNDTYKKLYESLFRKQPDDKAK